MKSPKELRKSAKNVSGSHVFPVEFGWDQKDELSALGCLKRFTNYIGPAIDENGVFLHQIRTANSLKDFWTVCNAFLKDNPHPYHGQPFTNLHAQPNKEAEDH